MSNPARSGSVRCLRSAALAVALLVSVTVGMAIASPHASPCASKVWCDASWCTCLYDHGSTSVAHCTGGCQGSDCFFYWDTCLCIVGGGTKCNTPSGGLDHTKCQPGGPAGSCACF